MITAESVIQALEAYIYKELVRCYDEKVVMACTNEMFECLYLNFHGQLMYIPTSYKSEDAKFYEAIYNDFTGSNHKQLAVKYKLSQPTIYKIVKTYRVKELRKLQSDMFPLSDEASTRPITIVVIEDYLPQNFLNCGLSDKDAKSISKDLSLFLCQNYPGISICISDTLRKKRASKNQLSLF